MKTFLPKHAPIDLLKYAGLFTWFSAGIPLLLQNWIFVQPLGGSDQVAWLLLHLAFGAAYWQQVKPLPELPEKHARIFSLVLMTSSALLVGFISKTALAGILLLIVAGVLPWMLSRVWGLFWLFGQNVALALVISQINGVDLADAALLAGLFLGVSLFAFTASVVGMHNIRARDELRKVNSELRATQALLAENTRIAERVRIARELHDLVGHHLTALTLNLEVVTHLVDGKSLEHVQQAHALAKLLLADVREVVSDMRDDDKVNLAEALRTLIDGVPEPHVHLDLAEEIVLTEPKRAQVLLRCAQEMITNSVRHAAAKNLWIEVRADAEGLSLSARDDGRGVSEVEAGNGLRGMSERLKQLGGKLEIESRPGAGFALHAWMPLEATT
jgi:signal transduction histidine kinase